MKDFITKQGLIIAGSMYPIADVETNEITHFIFIDFDLNQHIVDFDFNSYTMRFKPCDHEFVPTSDFNHYNSNSCASYSICHKCGYKP